MMNPLVYRHQQFPMFPYPMPGILPHRRGGSNEEEDLATVALQIQKKRFYIDVKKNWRGRFMKIAEVGMDGRKARILLTMSAADDLKEKLKDLTEIYEETVKSCTENETPTDSGDKPADSNEDGLIKSHVVNYPHRRYYLDLKRNRRGYFLRLTMLSTNARIKLAVPAEGMRNMYVAISDLLEKWWNHPPSTGEQIAVNLPEPKAFRIDNKTLYFDSVSNRYGVFLRISQVWAASRTAITIPRRSLNQFKEIINELAETLAVASLKDSSVGGAENGEKLITEVSSEPVTPDSAVHTE